MWKFFCVLREVVTGVCRTWCIGSSRLDVMESVAGADGGEE